MSDKKPILKRAYCRQPKAEDPRVCINIPQDIYNDLQRLCRENSMDFKEEILNRVALSLEYDDILMMRDRLVRLISCKKLSYEYKQRKKKKIMGQIKCLK